MLAAAQQTCFDPSLQADSYVEGVELPPDKKESPCSSRPGIPKHVDLSLRESGCADGERSPKECANKSLMPGGSACKDTRSHPARLPGFSSAASDHCELVLDICIVFDLELFQTTGAK